MTLNVVVVEDEPVARNVLQTFIASTNGLRLIGTAADSDAAIDLIDRTRPDLLFLDVGIPGTSGLDVLRRVAHRSAVIFTTGSERHAIAALQAGAVDYVVKPFGPSRLREAIERVRGRMAESWPRVFVRVGGTTVPVALASISRIEACDDYVTLHHGPRTHLLHVSLTELEHRLDPRQFVRIHRSHIVNLAHVRCVRSAGERRLAVVLLDGATLVTSRTGAPRLRRALANTGSAPRFDRSR